MSKIEKTLESLAETFKASDIMVTVDRLVIAHNEESARRLFRSKRNLDMIPIKSGNSLESYMERNYHRSTRIVEADIIRENTKILDVVDVLQSRKFSFVGTPSKINGLVHFSDLNNHLVKLPFFVIFEAFEEHLANEIRSLVDASNLPSILGEERFSTIEKKMQSLRKTRADLDWISLLSFEGIARCASYFGKIAQTSEQIKRISIVRNRVAHAGEPFVRRHGDVRRLSEVRKICMSVL